MAGCRAKWQKMIYMADPSSTQDEFSMSHQVEKSSPQD